MKGIKTLFVMALLLLGTFTIVSAENTTVTSDLQNSTIVLPEANRVGFFENFGDSLKYAFMFNKEHKAEFALQRAEKRLAEMEYFAEKNPEMMERARARYEALLNESQELLESIESSDEENNSTEDLEGILRIQERFEMHREKAAEIYTRALNKFQNNNASAEKIARFEEFYDRALNHSNRMEDKILEKRNNAVLKYKVMSEKSDEELEEFMNELENETGLIQAREQRKAREEIRNEHLEQIRNRILEGNFSKEEMEKIQENIDKFRKEAEEFREEREEIREEHQGNFN
jgi:hypothetical protein